MSSIALCVGLDYHQDSVQVCILNEDGKQLANRSVVNDAATIDRFIRRHGKARGIAIEACCGSADLVRVNYLPKVWLAPNWIRELRRLVRHRAQLVARRKDTKLRIRGLLRENRLRCPDASAWSKAWLAWLEDHADRLHSGNNPRRHERIGLDPPRRKRRRRS